MARSPDAQEVLGDQRLAQPCQSVLAALRNSGPEAPEAFGALDAADVAGALAKLQPELAEELAEFHQRCTSEASGGEQADVGEGHSGR
mmetsp:Transcript_2884/g.8793  ORF Transcript_2884/g.8793 Transcript_2884/m.8793 type:complete len:88 (+) Transcript_2884:1-264(+)